MESNSIYESLSSEEKKQLAETEDFANLAQHPAWLKLKTFMQADVQVAEDTMAGNISGEPKTYMYLQVRWQQRRAMMRSIIQFVDSMIEQRNELLGRATEEPDEYGN